MEQESSEGNHRVAAVACRRSSSSSSNRVIFSKTLAIVEEHQSSTTEPNCDETLSSAPPVSFSENLVLGGLGNNPHTLSAPSCEGVECVVENENNDSENCQASARRDDCELEIDLPTEELGIIVASDGPLGAVGIASHPLMDLDAIQPDILHLSTDDQPIINNTVTTANDGLNQQQLIDERPLLMRRNPPIKRCTISYFFHFTF